MADVPDNETLGRRVTLLTGFVKLLELGYDALLHHGINYRDLKSYKDTAALDHANKLVLKDGFAKIVTWMERVENDIIAAVRRKHIRPVT